ncbi:MAG: Gfo/Idh/MocA family oxidoreductase [Kiritimatiellae bacterium]|nr:Gfo/Idh/MocA family oxidoreductase [Kiritimatiellia bacterium]
MDKIRIGVIGSGGIFRNLHAPYYQKSDRAQIVAVADLNTESAAGVAGSFGAAVCTDYREILDRKDVDAVDVSVHPKPHREMAVAAAEAGKHILMEKPMCCTVAEADAMIEAAKRAGVRLQVAYVLPFNPIRQKLKALLADGTLGELQMAYRHQMGWFKPQKPWLFDKAEAGGMLLENAIHTFDEWLWLYGPAESVYASTSHVPLGDPYPAPEKAVENNAVVNVRFKNGGTAVLLQSWASELGAHGEGMVGSRGSATIGSDGLRWKTHDMAEAEAYKPVVDNKAPKAASIEHWLKCIAGEETPRTAGEVGRAGVEIGEAAYRSSETGQVVSLPLRG